jgi:hypothetical protein
MVGRITAPPSSSTTSVIFSSILANIPIRLEYLSRGGPRSVRKSNSYFRRAHLP